MILTNISLMRIITIQLLRGCPFYFVDLKKLEACRPISANCYYSFLKYKLSSKLELANS